MHSEKTESNTRGSEETWSVVVVYDTQPTRQRAMQVCDQLVERFWQEVEFRFDWWRTDFLRDTGMAAASAESSIQADFIVVCVSSESAVSPLLKRWFDTWSLRRENREGAFIDVPAPDNPSPGPDARRQSFWREVAHRAGMDYLTELPPTMTRSLPESFSAASDRAKQMTSVLNDILHHSPPPKLNQT